MKTWLTAFAAVSCQINEECVSIDNGKLCEDDCVDVFAQCVVQPILFSPLPSTKAALYLLLR